MPATIRPTTIYPITTRKLQVLRAVDVTPGMRRVTIGGSQLAAHTAQNGMPVAAFRSDGFDDEFKLILPSPETGELVVPTQNDGRLNWPRDSFAGTRTYTVRRWDPLAGEIDIDVVKHGKGPATTWAYTCQEGEDIHIAGPKMSGAHPESEWVLIAGDETALPAIARWLEEMPAGVRAQVYIEIENAERAQELRTDADASITWLDRNGAPAGTTTLMLDALRSAPWISDDVFAWIAGEALTLAPIRRWLRGEKGLDKTRVEVTGYWRRSGEADGAEAVAAPEEDVDEALHELLEIVPGIAARVAVTAGIFAELTRGPSSSAAIAASLGLHPGATERLLRYLASVGLATREGGNYGPSAMGEELDDEYYTEQLDLTGLNGAREAGILALLPALRTGSAGYPSVFGVPFEDVVASSSAMSADTLDRDEAHWVSEPLSRARMLAGVTDLRLAGEGSATVAAELTGLRPDLALRVLVLPSAAQAARDWPWPDASRVSIELGSLIDQRPEPSQAYLLLDALSPLPDADASHVLAQAAASCSDGSVLVLDNPLDADSDHDHDFEADLVWLATTGGASRTAEQTDALARAAGLELVERETIGWGVALRRYRRIS